MNAYNTPEDFLADETFVEWAEKSNDTSAKKWEEWMQVNYHKKDIVEEALLLIKTMKVNESVSQQQIDAAWQNLQQNLQASPQIKKRSIPLFVRLSVAAIFIIALSITIFRSGFTHRPTLKTSYGQIAKNLLPDGTEITLNANSEIKYATKWKAQEDREVWLKGEGLFHVKRTTANSRFIVHTNEFDIIVTGTVFNVINRNGASSVVLKEGSITIKNSKGELTYLRPGDYLEYNSKSLVRKQVEPDALVAWTDQKLVFDKTPLARLAEIIKEYYGIDVQLSDPKLLEETISGVLPNDNLDVLIKSLEATGEYKISKEDKRLVIHPNHK